MWLTPWSVTPALSVDKALYCPSWQRKHVYRVWLQYYKAGQRRVDMELRDNKLKTGTGTFFSKLSSLPELLLPNIATFATIPCQAPFSCQLPVASCQLQVVLSTISGLFSVFLSLGWDFLFLEVNLYIFCNLYCTLLFFIVFPWISVYISITLWLC